jgi:hypothetical protein
MLFLRSCRKQELFSNTLYLAVLLFFLYGTADHEVNGLSFSGCRNYIYRYLAGVLGKESGLEQSFHYT